MWRFGTLSCRIPHISCKFGPSSRGSSFYCALLDPSRLRISCVHLCSRHSKLLAFRRVDLQHALYFGLKHFASCGHVPGDAHITSSLGHRAADTFRRRTSCICRHFWVGIRAQNGRSHRMCCTLDTDTCRSSGDAQIARTAFKSSGGLSGWSDASQIRSQQRMACTMRL